MKINSRLELASAAKRGRLSLYPGKTKITVGMATCGVASGAQAVYETIAGEIEKRSLDVIVRRTGCVGFCQQEPLVDVLEPGLPRITYGQMNSKLALDLVVSLSEGRPFHSAEAIYRVDDDENIITAEKINLAGKHASNGWRKIPSFQSHPFFKKQKRIILRNCGLIDPENIEEYFARGGYLALYKTIREMTPVKVNEVVKDSGLRGRGGAGFSTGKKWEFCRLAPGQVKYVICNADEGDPGAFMDRSVLESDPFSVLEGMAIGAFAIGATDGFVYVRAEYPLAIERLRAAIVEAEEYGLLGDNILGSDFSIRVTIAEGAGAFVCGEETGLLASIEGKVGEPRERPPYPAYKGLWNCPTNINNVKTWASVPPIVARGSSWFRSVGSEGNCGTTVFSLVGKIKNTGLVEVPLGIPLREMIYDIGGGLQDNKPFKAVQTGGPSGGCLPASMLDLPVDYEHLTEAGSMMGSGGMIVMDSDTCMVDVAKYFLEFTTDESCGKCTPCREGTRRMHQILTRITEGRGKPGDSEHLQSLAQVIKDTALCGLGATAPNPVLTTLRFFHDEYEAHVRERRCPGRVCKDLISYSIDSEKCNGCLLCLKQCPTEAIVGQPKVPHKIIADRCIKCGACTDVCKQDAVIVK